MQFMVHSSYEAKSSGQKGGRLRCSFKWQNNDMSLKAGYARNPKAVTPSDSRGDMYLHERF